ncbi:Transcription factor [Penicillium chermesinum]|uniref:Transcription factor n=1 Tax=Penicillium chermesinum TaxID=63820 RepID=A0A9W9TT55_9EURO|nr:Transcription factor [Penicillium chermesinum]KAJ5238584.1 Transcription factor [Penicillium chermesinum]KAJ6164236.1 Transcription factor [Penicillium chermesinum]
MAFGRPASIPDNYAKLELPSKHQLEMPPSLIDENTTCLSVSFFGSAMTLYKELWNILDLLYGLNISVNPSLSVGEATAHISRVKKRLIAWEGSLPRSLQLIGSLDLDLMTRD